MSVLQALKWVFWGILIVAVCNHFKGFDLLGGVLGYAIIATGMISLVRNSVSGRQGVLIKLIALVVLLDALLTPFVATPGNIPGTVKTASLTLSILTIFAAVGFAVVMRRLCATIPLQRQEHTWKTNVALWLIGLPASVGATLVSFWATRNENGVISPGHTPPSEIIPLFILSVVALIVWIHFLVALWQTIAGLKGMVKKLPSASDFGLDQRPSFHFQFSIPALLIALAAAAIFAVGVSQKTVPYWQATVAGLVAVSLLATCLDHRALSKALLVVAMAVLVAGYTQLTRHSQSAQICGTNSEVGYLDVDYQLSDSFLKDIDGWLVAQGYERSQPPTNAHGPTRRFAAYDDLPLAPEAKTAIWYAGTTPNSEGVVVRVLYSKTGRYLHFVSVDYNWDVVEFLWTTKEREKTLDRFVRETTAKWHEYLQGQQKPRSNP